MTLDENMLKAAAQEVSDSLLSTAETLAEEEHTFSAEFEKKVDSLMNKKRFPWRQVVLVAAAILALVLVVVSASLSSAVDVRAEEDELTNRALLGYARSGRTEECTMEELPEYELAYIPEGYTLENVSKADEKVLCQYACDRQGYLRFSYVGASENVDDVSYKSGVKYISVPFKNTRAHLYLDETRYGVSSIVWTDPDTNILFKISFQCSQQELLRLANSVREKEKNK